MKMPWSKSKDESGTEDKAPLDTKPAAERRLALEQKKRELETDKADQLAAIDKARRQIQAEHQLGIEAAEKALAQAVAVEQARLAEEFGTADDKRKSLTTFEQQEGEALQTKKRQLDAARDRDLTPLEAQLKAIEPEHQRLMQEAEALEEQTLEALSAKLVKDLFAEVEPLAAQYMQTRTKEIAERIARCFFMYDLRSKRELGEELSRELVRTVFIDKVLKTYPNGLGEMGQVAIYSTNVWRVFDQGPRAINRALFTLIDDLEAAAEKGKDAPTEWQLGQHAIVRGSATSTQLAQNARAFRAESEERQRRESAANFVPLSRPHSPYAGGGYAALAHADEHFSKLEG